MRADLLHVVTAIYNPIRWNTRIAHCRTWLDNMRAAGVQITLIECALGDRPFVLTDEPGVEHIGVRANTLAWNKEALINLAIQRSQIRTPYIAWIDADVIFRNPNWAVNTVHALQQYAVVQPWSEAIDLGPHGEPMLIKGFHVQTSFSKIWHEVGDIKAQAKTSKPGVPLEYAQGWMYPHPGYAWAMRRDVLNNIGGLIEASGLGAGDHQMAMSFIGKIENSIHGQTNKQYQDVIRAWGERAFKFVQGNLGYVGGTIEHLFHGEKDKRKYQERWDVLIKHDYNPLTDLRRNLDGVIELAGNKPLMAADFDRYFRSRDEDANIRLG